MKSSVIHNTLRHYSPNNVKFIVRDYNKLFPLPYYFRNMLPARGTYKIADLACGPVCKLGGKNAGTKITIYASDVLAEKYNAITDEIGEKLLIPIEYQDMESLTYPDNFFDVVHCVNALDHTENIKKAISEMKRVCKNGGWIYLRHAPGQKGMLGGGHFWNATLQGFSNGIELITLDGFETNMNVGFIISTMQKNEIR